MSLLPLVVLLLVIPLGVAGQNIGIACATLGMLVKIFQEKRPLTWQAYQIPFVAGFAFILFMVLASALNGSNPKGVDASIFWGYLSWVLLPWLVMQAYHHLTSQAWRRLETVLACVCGVLGGTALSQALFGWHLDGIKFVAGLTRAQGYYSHPLTFAYAALLLFPYGCVRLVRSPQRWQGWLIFAGTAIAIYASQSRTVQIIAAALVFVNILLLARGRWRLGLFGATVLCGALIAFTDNPVSYKFGKWMHHGWDTHSDYADDRLAFWVANWEMVKDRPILGHGDNTNAEYRTPYYERIGLANFPRKYEAHNMYLQILVSGGALALSVFLIWLVWMLQRANQLRRQINLAADDKNRIGIAPLEMLAALLLGGITQNALQDAEVRYILVILCSAICLGIASNRQNIAQHHP